MASRMAGVGQETVSERKSILSIQEVYVIRLRLQVATDVQRSLHKPRRDGRCGWGVGVDAVVTGLGPAHYR